MVKSLPVQNWHGGSRPGNRSARLDPTRCPGVQKLGTGIVRILRLMVSKLKELHTSSMR